MLQTVKAIRYVAPLREGGSVPALVEADDFGMYVVKLRGSAQGTKSLVAELVAGRIIQLVAERLPDLGLRVPRLVLVDLPDQLSLAEPDPELQEPLKKSSGLNVGLDFLPMALPFLADERSAVAGELAASIVWLDAFLENVDRTPRNPNMLLWHKQLWLIDNGAALYKQHMGLANSDPAGEFKQIAQHALLAHVTSFDQVADRIAGALDDELIELAVNSVPAEFEVDIASYSDYLSRRLAARASFEQQIRHEIGLIGGGSDA